MIQHTPGNTSPAFVHLHKLCRRLQTFNIHTVEDTLRHNCLLKMRSLFTNYHYSDVIIGAMASQITNLKVVCSTTDERKHQSSASLAFERGIHRWPVNSPYKGPVTRKKVSIWWRDRVSGAHVRPPWINSHNMITYEVMTCTSFWHYRPFVMGIHLSPLNFPYKGSVMCSMEVEKKPWRVPVLLGRHDVHEMSLW